MMMYLMHTGLLLGGCFLYYTLLLRNETHFSLNRWLLLACLAGSLLLPLVTVPAGWSLREALVTEADLPVATPVEAAGETYVESATVPMTSVTAATEFNESAASTTSSPSVSSVSPAKSEAANIAPASTTINWFRLLWWLYLAGVAVFGLHFLVQLGYLVVKMIRHPGFDAGGFHLVELNEDAAPYSFWNRVFLNPDRYDPETYHQIVQHEAVHVRQRHSIDLMLAELLIIFQWFNPFAWLYRKAIENNLEFLTDAEVLRQGENPVDYQLSLVKVAAPNYPLGLTTSYNQSLLEKRIAMMKAKKSSLASGWKYLSLLPLLLLSMLQFNAVAQVPAPPAPPASAEAPLPPSAPPAPVATPNAPLPAPAPPAGAVPAPPTPPAPAPAPTWASASAFTPVPAPIPVPVPMPMRVTVASPVTGAMVMTNPKIDFSSMPLPTPNVEQVLKVSNAALEAARRSWTAEIEDNEVCFTFIVSDGTRQHLSTNSRCFPREKLGVLPTGQMGEFSLKRASGTVVFNGVFDGNEGIGNFTFTPDPAFVKTLADAGYEYEDLELLHFFFIDFTPGYLTYLRQQGFQPTERELFKLAIFGFDEATFKQTQADYRKAGFAKTNLEEMIELRIHGVNGKYINELSRAGYAGLTLEQIKTAKIHGLSADFVNDMAQAGFRNLAFDDVITMAIHGVSSAYVKELADLGYSGLDADDVVAAKIHGVSTQGMADLKKAGFTNLTLEEARTARIHGVDAAYVRELADLGYRELDMDEIVAAKIHGVSARRIGDLKKAGLTDLSLKEAREAAIHGVDADYVRELADLGYAPLSIDEVVQAKIHGVSERKIGDLKKAGLTGLTLKEAREAAIHGVNADQVRELRELGYTDLTFKNYVEARIHGVSPTFVRSYSDAGFGKIAFKDLVSLKIHGVSPEFLKNNKRDGDSLGDLIDYKIRRGNRD